MSDPQKPGPGETLRVTHLSATQADTGGLPDRPNVEASANWIGMVVAGCRIQQRIGAGGMGVVYRAEQIHPRRPVAIKTLHNGLNTPELLARFALEAEILGRMRHPGIAQVFATGHIQHGGEDIPYIVMEFIDGQPLLDYAESLNVQASVELLATITDAVEHAHLRGVIHRDLKPANILVQADGQPKVLDFGVARLNDADSSRRELTTAGMILGTMAYMSPEQAGGNPDSIDLRTDIYALGVIGYRLLARQLPYNVDRASLGEVLRAICDTRPAPLSRYCLEARGDLEVVIAKSLEKDRDQRYRNATEFADDLRRVLADESILARSPGWWEELRRYARRNKVLVSAAALVLLSLVSAAVISTRFAVAEQAQRVQAEAAIGFLQEMLSSANPVISQGRDVTLREVMDQASSSLDQALDTSPEVRGRLRLTLAETYRALGDLPRALDYFRQAQSALESGNVSRSQMLSARIGEARALHDSGRLIEARRVLDDLLASSAFDAETQPLQAMALLIRAAALAALQDNQPALADFVAGRQLLQRTRAMSCQVCGPNWNQRHSIWAMARQAALLRTMEQLDDATLLAREAWTTAVDSLGETDPDSQLALNNLALILSASGDSDEALALLGDAYQQRQQLLGDSHWQTLIAANNLALALQRDGEGEQADSLLTAAMQQAEQSLEDDHPIVAQLHDTLGQLRYYAGDMEEANRLLEQAWQRRLRRQGASHPLTLESATFLALVRARVGDADGAEALYRQALTGTQTRFGSAHRQSIVAHSEYASFLRDQTRFAAADEAFAEALTAAREVLPEGDTDRLRVLFQYSGSLQRQQRFAEAAELSAALIEEVERASEPESLFALAAPVRHALSLAGLDQYAEAETVLLDHVAAIGEEAPAQIRAMLRNTLVKIYTDWDKPDQAALWREG